MKLRPKVFLSLRRQIANQLIGVNMRVSKKEDSSSCLAQHVLLREAGIRLSPGKMILM
jgi:hypothetical protein